MQLIMQFNGTNEAFKDYLSFAEATARQTDEREWAHAQRKPDQRAIRFHPSWDFRLKHRYQA